MPDMQPENGQTETAELHMDTKQKRRIPFMNTAVDNLTMREALREINRLVQTDNCSYAVTPNVDHIVQLEKDPLLREIYRNADLVLTDGKPLVWISHLYKTPIREKVSGSDLFPLLCKLAAKKHYRLFFLGAAEGVADKAANRLKQRIEGLEIVGTYSPPVGFEHDTDEIQRIIDRITEAAPHILIVALGAPKQETFIYRYRKELKVPFSIGLGASIDFEAGVVKRAPKWMCDHGLEWLFRITQDPKRLLKRYLVDDLPIIRLVFKYYKGDKTAG